jgi:hypothetical protein
VRRNDEHPGDYSRPQDQVRAERNAQPVLVLRSERQVVIPAAEPDWHPVAQEMYLALTDSPQAAVFSSVDWVYAKFAIGELSDYLNGDYTSRGRTKGKSAVALEAIDRILSKVVMPPADRLRLRVAVEPPPPPAPRPLSLDEIEAAITAEEGAPDA